MKNILEDKMFWAEVAQSRAALHQLHQYLPLVKIRAISSESDVFKNKINYSSPVNERQIVQPLASNVSPIFNEDNFPPFKKSIPPIKESSNHDPTNNNFFPNDDNTSSIEESNTKEKSFEINDNKNDEEIQIDKGETTVSNNLSKESETHITDSRDTSLENNPPSIFNTPPQIVVNGNNSNIVEDQNKDKSFFNGSLYW